jgi:hypothetical protein
MGMENLQASIAGVKLDEQAVLTLDIVKSQFHCLNSTVV